MTCLNNWRNWQKFINLDCCNPPQMSLRLDAPSLAQFPPQAHPMGPQHHAAQAHGGGQPHPHPTPPPQDLEQKFIPPK